MNDRELIKQIAVNILSEDLRWSESMQMYLCKGSMLPFDPINNANHWMMIVEKITKTGDYVLQLTFHGDEISNTVALWDHIAGEDWELFEDNLIGRAVCLAALEATKGELHR